VSGLVGEFGTTLETTMTIQQDINHHRFSAPARTGSGVDDPGRGSGGLGHPLLVEAGEIPVGSGPVTICLTWTTFPRTNPGAGDDIGITRSGRYLRTAGDPQRGRLAARLSPGRSIVDTCQVSPGE
jgi:hypothetical protein